jgi:hypothetical protein
MMEVGWRGGGGKEVAVSVFSPHEVEMSVNPIPSRDESRMEVPEYPPLDLGGSRQN